MKNKCEYCNNYHNINHICPPNRRDSLHHNKPLDIESNLREQSFGERLRDGFIWLHKDEEYITDKFGNIRGSGNY